ncbi:aminoglycoside 6-adenylyltransferase [Sinobaca sp. H24]|uniref:aminoglycoside 6-adenylyltransferase n=1 Tax=Sinobaca sp. H24 TaxID=2923376 RepID=UPI0020793321|nr:aminoglycoside 6-adenylyltransferase [Sinobaca sp. H24]
MKNQEEMITLLFKKAQVDPAVKAACLNGSRVNPNRRQDLLQDFDLVYLVDDLDPFIRQREWLQEFGDLLIMHAAKGAWRSEVLYAMDYLAVMREMLLRMTTWYAGASHSFPINIGKSYKHLPLYVSGDIWKRLKGTFPKAAVVPIWEAVFHMSDLFLDITLHTANLLEMEASAEEAQNVYRYLQHLHQLPQDTSKWNLHLYWFSSKPIRVQKIEEGL